MDYFFTQQIHVCVCTHIHKKYIRHRSKHLSVNKRRQKSIPTGNTFTTCKKKDAYALEYQLGSYGIFYIFWP